MKKSLGLIAVLLGLSLQAHAFIVEPFVSYEMGKYDSDDDITGTALGIRVGGTNLGFMYGFEYQTANLKIEVGTTKNDFKPTDMGVFVGYEFPVLLRVYATYYFSHKAEVGTASDVEGDGGMKLGIGFTGLPFVAINLEKVTRMYDKQGSSTIDVETDSTLLCISLPLP